MEVNQLYVAGTGLISAIGNNATMNWCSFRADINCYQQSDYRTDDFFPVKLALIPEDYFGDLTEAVELGSQTSFRHARILLAAFHAIQESISPVKDLRLTDIPIVQACPNLLPTDAFFNSVFHKNLIALSGVPAPLNENTAPFYRINTGRAGVIEAIEIAFKLFESSDIPFVLVGGADSFDDPHAIKLLDGMKRLSSDNSKEGFCPGDGAGYILLTNKKGHALRQDNKYIAVNRPSISFEEGHMFSEVPYKGESLTHCFKQQFNSLPATTQINTIYSSMNGEHFWAKEYGLARIRNHQYFEENLALEHPADCYGDLGAACAGALMVLACQDLFTRPCIDNCLVYSSSDHGYQAATLLSSHMVDS